VRGDVGLQIRDSDKGLEKEWEEGQKEQRGREQVKYVTVLRNNALFCLQDRKQPAKKGGGVMRMETKYWNGRRVESVGR
jgi:hypothetical protein